MKVLRDNYGPVTSPFWKKMTNGRILVAASVGLSLGISTVREKVANILHPVETQEQFLQAIKVHPNRTQEEAEKMLARPVKPVQKNESRGTTLAITHEKDLQHYLDGIVKKYPNETPRNSVTGSAVIRSAQKFHIPWSTLMAILQNDSHFGTQGKGKRNNNPGNYGQTDEKDRQGITVPGYKTIEEGIDAVSKNILHRIHACQKICGKGYSPSAYEIVSGKVGGSGGPHSGKKFFGPYMTHTSGPATVAKIEHKIRTGFQSTLTKR